MKTDFVASPGDLQLILKVSVRPQKTQLIRTSKAAFCIYFCSALLEGKMFNTLSDMYARCTYFASNI